jgi:DNA repair protein RecO (recombination protein O)
MLEEIHIEAFTLSSLPFRDFDRIVTLFSKEQGLIKVLIKGANRPKSSRLIFCQPLTYSSFILQKKRSELALFSEGKLIDPFLSLRISYDHLKASFDLSEALLKISMTQNPCADLFLLFKSYLNQISKYPDPSILTTSFYLKISLYEGCLTLKRKCTNCNLDAEKLYFCFKDYFCARCAPARDLEFSQQELALLLELVKEKSFDQLKSKTVTPDLNEKVRKLYAELHEIDL